MSSGGLYTLNEYGSQGRHCFDSTKAAALLPTMYELSQWALDMAVHYSSSEQPWQIIRTWSSLLGDALLWANEHVSQSCAL